MLSALNALPNSEAFDLLYKVCSSRVWTNAMVAHRPFQSLEHMQTQAALLDQQLNQDDWLEAFAGHPMVCTVYFLNTIDQDSEFKRIWTRLDVLRNNNSH